MGSQIFCIFLCFCILYLQKYIDGILNILYFSTYTVRVISCFTHPSKSGSNDTAFKSPPSLNSVWVHESGGGGGGQCISKNNIDCIKENEMAQETGS